MTKDWSKSQIFEFIYSKDFCDDIEQVGTLQSECSWKMGEWTQQALDELLTVKSAIVRGDVNPENADAILAFGSMDVYSQLALRFGVRTRTLRDYCSIYKFFLRADISKYSVLPFSHFRFAKSCGPDLAFRVLDLSLTAMDSNGGRPPSVEWLDVNLHRVTADESVIADVEAVQDFASSASLIPGSDFETGDDEPLPQSVYYFLNSITTLLESLQKKLDKLDIENGRVEKIQKIIVLVGAIADELLASEREEC